MIKAHKIRLDPTPEQAKYFARAAGTARFTFNWAVAQWQREYEAGGKPSALALRTKFNALKANFWKAAKHLSFRLDTHLLVLARLGSQHHCAKTRQGEFALGPVYHSSDTLSTC